MPVAQYVPDSLDRRIIACLRTDGRAPLSKLAAVLGVARGTVQTRLDRLLEAGAITGFTVRVREDHDDVAVRAVMMIEVVGKSTTDVIKRLHGIAEIRSVHTTNGNWDLISEIRAENLVDFDRVLRDVRMISGVSNSETNIMLNSM